MTTIAYKDGVIATDGRTCRGPTIINDDTVKRYEHRGAIFWISGFPHEYHAVLDDIIDRRKSEDDGLSAGGFVLMNGTLYSCGHTDGFGWRCDLVESCSASGSGMDHALTAMDMGADAQGAIAMAAKRDTGTGGVIRLYDSKTGHQIAGRDLKKTEGGVMGIKNMSYVTVEQVLALRDAAIRSEAQRDKLAEALGDAVEWDAYDDTGVEAVWLSKARAALKQLEEE